MATRKKRKVVQIAVGSDDHVSDRVYMLCDDGTLWLHIQGERDRRIEIDDVETAEVK
jgi:hypothetical protein